jgi:hypothetical protein
MLKRRTAALVLLGLAACLTLKFSGSTPASIRPLWAEIKWGFPIDQWGGGKAFHCDAVACGADIDVFLRPKLGFCKCTSGVDDDAELERVADFDLFGDEHTAVSTGHPITVRWMNGRSRPYSFPRSFGQTKSILTIAFNDRCDAIVATAIASHNHPEEVESVVLGLLNGDIVIRWIELTLGL